MIEIEVARTAGFCLGVRRAVALAERVAGESEAGRVVSLGPLMHNPEEVERLRGIGVEPVEWEEVRPDQVVIVRSHGIPAEQRDQLEARGRTENGTCPHVRVCQQLAERMAAEGYAVVVVGDPGHPETDSIVSHAVRGGGGRTPVLVVDGPSWLVRLQGTGCKKVAVLAQTTQSPAALAAVTAECLGSFGEVRMFNTVCDATVERQREARELAGRADLVLVVGGRDSANTRRLVEICAREQPRTHQIELAAEIRRSWLAGSRRVAVTAGASTPQRTVQEVVARLEELGRSVDDGGTKGGPAPQ